MGLVVPNNFNFRTATEADAAAIAQLHTESWQNSYRGMMDDHFLDHEAYDNRLDAWRERLHTPPLLQLVLLAEEQGQLSGFACVLPSDSPHGLLLDNLHIRSDKQGVGLGRQLMKRAAAWIQEETPFDKMHLWVFANNVGAIRFYQRLGGREAGEKLETNFGVQPVRSLLYVWDDASVIDQNA